MGDLARLLLIGCYLTTAVGVQFITPIGSGGQVNFQMRQAVANPGKPSGSYE